MKDQPKTIVTIALPADAAAKLLKKWQEKDPEMMKELESLGVIDMKPTEPKEPLCQSGTEDTET